MQTRGSANRLNEVLYSTGKPVVISLHTPEVPTHQWTAGTPLTWTEELRMPQGDQALKPGEYSVFLSVVDADTNRRVSFLNGLSGKPAVDVAASVGTLKVVPATQTSSSTPNPQ